MPNRINNHSINSVNRAQQFKQKNVQKTDRQFQAFVDEALKNKEEKSDIQVSNHAKKRLEQRGIQLNPTDMSNLKEAFSTLDHKGAENSLIMYDDLSLIASVKNRTIITAAKTEEMTEEMTEVTNIDSAIHVTK